ncbi:MAG TPA: PhaM family polyhydroxyalkanoate granule multifunctional regulatory protein [Ramlibacter sp.]|nr:PhaM family polyhydroxyalkanoate granule multifunctional regulatory protein [Ramlibacter sp.]
MSDQNFGFGKFVPGFDFLQNIAKGASQTIPQMPNLANWVAPTLNLEELEKRIDELKAVHFWLDQNSKALSATIQALEVQKMTLATLKGMNFNMGDVANALKLKTADAMFGGAQKVTAKVADTARTVTEAATEAVEKTRAARKSAGKGADQGGNGVVDPLQWWGALTQQFQEIAAGAMKDVARQTAVDAARNMAAGMAKEALKTATGVAKAATGTAIAGARKTAARKPAKKAPRRPATAP